MDVYVGDGDVVKMECKKTGDRKSPNQHEWVLRADAEKRIGELEMQIVLLKKIKTIHR